MSQADLLPRYITPTVLAEHLGVNERFLRERARQLGAYRKLGKRMILTERDVETIMEASRPCPSKSQSAAKSGTTPGQSPEGDYAVLQARLTKKSPKGSQPKKKPELGKVILMGQGPA